MKNIQTWIEKYNDEVTSYITAYRQALRWVYDPAYANDVLAIMQNELSLGLDASVPHHVYAVFVDPKFGFGQEPLLDDAGLKQVIDLRAKYTSSPIIGDLAHYRDHRLYPR